MRDEKLVQGRDLLVLNALLHDLHHSSLYLQLLMLQVAYNYPVKLLLLRSNLSSLALHQEIGKQTHVDERVKLLHAGQEGAAQTELLRIGLEDVGLQVLERGHNLVRVQRLDKALLMDP